jgi:hypothetical protein
MIAKTKPVPTNAGKASRTFALNLLKTEGISRNKNGNKYLKDQKF